MSPARRTAVYLEVTRGRSFACAVDWPGWSRSARGDQAALEVLARYAPRYRRAAARAGLTVPTVEVSDLEVVETISGNATTQFGAPNVVAEVDRHPLSVAQGRRVVALLAAAWSELDVVVAGAPATLRKGPRGGGRDRDAIAAHVVDAERAYARHVGVRLTAPDWRTGHVDLLRERIRDAISRPAGGAGATPRPWPLRYLARRIAWHALDHAWEIEDRSS